MVVKKLDARLRLHDIWALEAIDGEEIDFTDKARRSRPTIEFNLIKMWMMGTDGCNSFDAMIETVDDSSLLFGSIRSTLMACSDYKRPRTRSTVRWTMWLLTASRG